MIRACIVIGTQALTLVGLYYALGVGKRPNDGKRETRDERR